MANPYGRDLTELRKQETAKRMRSCLIKIKLQAIMSKRLGRPPSPEWLLDVIDCALSEPVGADGA